MQSAGPPANGERLVVLWRIEERCNLRCAFCGYASDLRRPRRATSEGEIRRLIALFAEVRRERRGPVLLSWFGGEPLLRDDLPELTREAVRAGLLVSTTTNGTTLGAAEARRHVLDCYTELTLSVDGLAPFHDRVRGAKGCFDRVEAAARALVRERRAVGRGPLLRVNCVLMRDNVRAFPELARALATWGIDEITINQLGGDERPEYHREHALRPDDADFLADTLPELRRELERSGVRLLGGPAYLGRISATARAERLAVADCRPGETFLFVDVLGRASPCSFTLEELAFPLARLGTGRQIGDLPGRFRASLGRASPPSCSDCMSTRTFAKFTRA